MEILFDFDDSSPRIARKQGLVALGTEDRHDQDAQSGLGRYTKNQLRN